MTIVDTGTTLDAKLATRGGALYAANCARCHGHETINAGPLTSLTASAALTDSKQWNLIAFAGLLGGKGMPGFMGDLKADEVEAIRAYVLQQAARLKATAITSSEVTRATPSPR